MLPAAALRGQVELGQPVGERLDRTQHLGMPGEREGKGGGRERGRERGREGGEGGERGGEGITQHAPTCIYNVQYYSPYVCSVWWPFPSRLDEVVGQDLRHGCGEIEQQVLCAELCDHAELLHQQLSIVQSRDERLPRKVLRDSPQSLQHGGQVLQDCVELLAVWPVGYGQRGS